MKKVLIIVAGNNGTIGRCSLNLLRAFKERDDVEVKCVGVHRFDNGFEGFTDCEFFSNNDQERGGNLLKQVKWLSGVKNAFKPDLTISTLHSADVLNCLYRVGDKRVGIFHAPHKQGRAFGLIKYIMFLLPYWLLFRRLDLCSCVSKEVEEDFRHFWTIKKERVKTVYNIHLVDEIVRKANEPVEDLPSTAYFVYCGRLDANKAPIRAVKALVQSNTDASLVIVGKGEETFVNSFKEQVNSLGLSERVVLLGEKANPYPYIKGAKALVSSSYSEGLPGVIIEAMALGVPVVSTNSSRGIWEILCVESSYDSSLSGIFETLYGVISSNLSYTDGSKEEYDIDNLAKGLEIAFNTGHFSDAAFLPNVDGGVITTQYLSLLD